MPLLRGPDGPMDDCSDPPSRGSETVAWQELQKVREQYSQWLQRNLQELWSEEDTETARRIEESMTVLSDGMDVEF